MTTTTIGVVSDTHGLLRPAVPRELSTVDAIVHAGDFDEAEILTAMREIGRPLTAVRGNCDHGAWADEVPETAVVEIGGATLYVIHDLGQLAIEPSAAGIDVVIYGHSHRPEAVEKNGVLYLNPGSAGPRRFRLPITMARLRVTDGVCKVEMIDLEPAE